MKPSPDISQFRDATVVAPALPARAGLARHLSELSRKTADYVEMAKPRLNFLVLVTTAVGYYMAAMPDTPWMLLVHTLVGTGLTAASASILNQLIERQHDLCMKRTRTRPIPSGRVAPVEAFVLGLVTGLAGVIYLAAVINPLTALLGLFTWLTYLLIYTPLKRRSTLNTIVGAIPGATPPVMGWTAVTGSLAPEAACLFGILFLWQMPHFLAIATMYREEYGAAGYRMLPVHDPDLKATSRQILLYGLALIPVSLISSMLHLTGWTYAVAALLLGLAFWLLGMRAAVRRDRGSARVLFFASIIYLPVLLAAMTLGKV